MESFYFLITRSMERNTTKAQLTLWVQKISLNAAFGGTVLIIGGLEIVILKHWAQTMALHGLDPETWHALPMDCHGKLMSNQSLQVPELLLLDRSQVIYR